jgi:hypothetical protein
VLRWSWGRRIGGHWGDFEELSGSWDKVPGGGDET